MNYLIEQAWIQALGWTLLHACWQGCLVAGAWAVMRNFLGQASANQRYLLAISTLLTLVLCAVITFWKVYPETISNPMAAVALDSIDFSTFEGISLPSLDMKGEKSWQDILNGLTPWLSIIWIIGATIMGMRFSAGLWQLKRLGNEGLSSLDDSWQKRAESIAQQMGLQAKWKLWESELVSEPLTLGHFKPIILIPAGMLSGLSPDQVEAIFAHEFAHIYRADFLFNLIQSLIEILFFFHPAVWWLSKEIRRERELCCDDLAVATLGDAYTYAEALTRLQSFCHSPKHFLTMQAKGNSGSFTARIQRLFIPQHSKPSGWKSFSAALLLMLGILGTGFYTYAQSERNAEEQRVNNSFFIKNGKINSFETKNGSTRQENTKEKLNDHPSFVKEAFQKLPVLVYLDGQSIGFYDGEADVFKQLYKKGIIKADDLGIVSFHAIKNGDLAPFLKGEQLPPLPPVSSPESHPENFQVYVLNTWEYLAKKYEQEGEKKHRFYIFDGEKIGFKSGNIKHSILGLCKSKEVDTKSITVNKLTDEEARSKYKIRAVEVIEIKTQVRSNTQIETGKGEIQVSGSIQELTSNGSRRLKGVIQGSNQNYYFFDGKPLGYREGEVMGVIASEIKERNIEVIGGIVICDADESKPEAGKVVQILSEEYEATYYKRLKEGKNKIEQLEDIDLNTEVRLNGEVVSIEVLQQIDPDVIVSIDVLGAESVKSDVKNEERGPVVVIHTNIQIDKPEVATSFDVEKDINLEPKGFLKLKVSPNPSTGTFNINFGLAQKVKVTFSVRDLRGKVIHKASPKTYESGLQKIIWKADKVANGMYIIQLETDEGMISSKRIILKR